MRALALVTCLVCFAGCARDPSPEDVAVTFLQLYALNVDQETAMTLASGLAKDKLLKELADVAAVRGEGFRVPTQRPKFRRELLRADHEGEEHVLYTYRITMTPEIGDETTRRMLIHVEELTEGWRVVDYQFWPDTGAAAAPTE